MKNAEDVAVVQKVYDLIKEMGQTVGKFPRDHKFLLGDRIMNAMLDLLGLYIDATYAPRPSKVFILDKANTSLEKLRFLVRLSYDFQCIPLKRLETLSGKIHEIGKMTGGWRKQAGNG